MKRFSSQKGFTMVELIVVIIILGILVAIAVPKYFSMKSQAEEAACRANMRAIQAAWVMKYSEALLKDPSTSPTDVTLTDADFSSGHMPECPQGGKYTITPNADGTVTITCPNGHKLVK